MLSSARPLMDSSLPNLSGFTILVIEDDLDSLETLTTALTACGARVLSALDTALARSYFETTQIDVVVTDLGLPGESGAAFLTWLRRQPRDKGRSTAAIVITGYPQEFPAVRLGGFAAYFQKPIDLLNVCMTIGAILRPPSGPSTR